MTVLVNEGTFLVFRVNQSFHFSISFLDFLLLHLIQQFDVRILIEESFLGLQVCLEKIR